MNRSIIFSLALFLAACPPLLGQERPPEPSFAISLGALYGNFSGSERIAAIYPAMMESGGAFVALGNGRENLLVKYFRFQGDGRTKIVNATVEGRGVWKQEIGEIGLRYNITNSIVFIDFAYTFLRVTEEISTVAPEIPELASSHKVQDRGMLVGIGLNPTLIGPFGFTLEAEYVSSFQSQKTSSGEKIPDIGGWMVSAGIRMTLE